MKTLQETRERRNQLLSKCLMKVEESLERAAERDRQGFPTLARLNREAADNWDARYWRHLNRFRRLDPDGGW